MKERRPIRTVRPKCTLWTRVSPKGAHLLLCAQTLQIGTVWRHHPLKGHSRSRSCHNWHTNSVIARLVYRCPDIWKKRRIDRRRNIYKWQRIPSLWLNRFVLLLDPKAKTRRVFIAKERETRPPREGNKQHSLPLGTRGQYMHYIHIYIYIMLYGK